VFLVALERKDAFIYLFTIFIMMVSLLFDVVYYYFVLLLLGLVCLLDLNSLLL